MLVLSRRSQQQIVFPNLGITLQILQVRGQIVKVGIEAPPEIAILRQETLASQSDRNPVANRSGRIARRQSDDRNPGRTAE